MTQIFHRKRYTIQKNAENLIPEPPRSADSVNYSIRRGRYWIASARCTGWMRPLPAKSAIVRASFS